MKKTQKTIALAIVVFSAVFLLTQAVIHQVANPDSLTASIVSSFRFDAEEKRVFIASEERTSYLMDREFEGFNPYREHTNEQELLNRYGNIIRISDEDQGKLSDREIEVMLFIAHRYQMNPALASGEFPVVPLYSQFMTTDGNWAALLSPLEPTLMMRQEKPGYYLSAFEVIESLAALLSTSSSSPVEDFMEYGILDSTEAEFWRGTQRTGVPLLLSADLLMRTLEASEDFRLSISAARNAQDDVALNVSHVRVSDQLIELMAGVFHEEQKLREEFTGNINKRKVEILKSNLKDQYGNKVTNADIQMARRVYMGSNAPEAFNLNGQYDLGSCENELNKKLVTGPYFEVGPEGAEITCELQINDRERGNLTVRFPANSVVVNFLGFPSIQKMVTSGSNLQASFEVLFPMNLRNTIVAGPEHEETIQITYQSKIRKNNDQELGLYIADSNGEKKASIVKPFGVRSMVSLALGARHFDDNRFFLYVDPYISGQ